MANRVEEFDDFEEEDDGQTARPCPRCGQPHTAANTVTLEGEVLEGRKSWALCPACARSVLRVIQNHG